MISNSKKYRVPFYFVLYLVVLVELLLVVIERDSTETELKERLAEYVTIQDSVISLYTQPIILEIKRNNEWTISNNDSLHLVVTVSNLQTPEEKASVEYYINAPEENNRNYHRVVTDKKTGFGNFYFKTNRYGTYSFDVYCKLKRQLPRYLPQVIIDGIYSKVGADFISVSDTVNFKVKAKHRRLTFDRPGRG
ncbi:MAG: hypothetical protein PVF17_13175 [Ignavibacteria bacterium]